MCPGTLCVPPAGPTTKWTSAIISLLNMTEFLQRQDIRVNSKRARGGRGQGSTSGPTARGWWGRGPARSGRRRRCCCCWPGSAAGTAGWTRCWTRTSSVSWWGRVLQPFWSSHNPNRVMVAPGADAEAGRLMLTLPSWRKTEFGPKRDTRTNITKSRSELDASDDKPAETSTTLPAQSDVG